MPQESTLTFKPMAKVTDSLIHPFFLQVRVIFYDAPHYSSHSLMQAPPAAFYFGLTRRAAEPSTYL